MATGTAILAELDPVRRDSRIGVPARLAARLKEANPDPVGFAPYHFAVPRLANVWFEHEFSRAEQSVEWRKHRALIRQVKYPAAHRAVAPLKDDQAALDNFAARTLSTLCSRLTRFGSRR
jgi:hypothetical protein